MRKSLRTLSVLTTIAISVLLTGCQRADYAENQAYAVMLGIDIGGENEISITVKYPKLAGGGGQSSSGGGDSSAYVTSSGRGSGFQEALNDLKIAVPREMNLSALTLVVISEEVVDAGEFESVLRQLTTNYRMYSSAYLAICEGKASEFIEKQEPEIGTRLSEGLKALIENAKEMGSIPDSKVADVFYTLNSVYSDPIIMACAAEKGSSKETEKNKYAGAYVITGGNISIKLDTFETVMANVLLGETEQFIYVDGTDTAFVSVDKRPRIEVKTGDKPTISVTLELSAMRGNGDSDINDYGEMLRKDIEDMLDSCKLAGAEPFGFAGRAAWNFGSIEDWQDYNWRDRFRDCDTEITVNISEIF